MKKITFAEGALGVVLNGNKRITIRVLRPEAHTLKKGEIFIGEFKNGVDILLRATEDTAEKLFSELSEADLTDDGYINSEHAFNDLSEYYTDLTFETMMAVIRFEILTVEDVPVIALNKYSEAPCQGCSNNTCSGYPD